MKFWLPMLAVVAGVSGAFCEDARGLKVGDAMPAFTATDETGKTVDLASFKDKEGMIIFFFPKAFTGG